MKNKRESHLSLLMDCFKTRVKDLVEFLHVDYSLVSKWRGNVRHLNPKSDYVDKIVIYYLTLDAPYQYAKIKNLLSDFYGNIEDLNKEMLSAILRKWLSEYEETMPLTLDSNSYTTQITIYRYDSGREKATFRILEELNQLPEGQELYIFDCEENSWKHRESKFLEKRKEAFRQIFKKHHLTIIHTLDAKYAVLKNLVKKNLRFSLTDQVDAFYLPRQYAPDLLSDMLIIRDHAAVICQFSEDLKIKRYAEYHNDIRTVHYYQELYKTIQDRSSPFYKKYYFDTKEELLKFLKKENEKDEKDGNVFLYANCPLLKNRSKRERESFVELEIGFQLFENHKNIYNETFKINTYQYIYNISDLEKIDKRKPEDPWIGSLSQEMLNGYINQLLELIARLEMYPNLEIGLVMEENEDKEIVIVKENGYSIACTYLFYKEQYLVLSASESTTTFVSYNNYYDYWNVIPPLQKNRRWVIKKIKAIIEELKQC